MQPRARERPVTLDRGWRDVEILSRFGNGQSAEVAQLDDPRGLRRDGGEPVQRVVEAHDIEAQIDPGFRHIVEARDGLAGTAFGRAVFPRVIDEDPAHHVGRRTVEVNAVREIRRSDTGEPQVGLVDERGRLQRVIGPFPREVMLRQIPEFTVHKGGELLERLGISPATVRVHIRNATGKLGASTRTQAVAIAVARGEVAAPLT